MGQLSPLKSSVPPPITSSGRLVSTLSLIIGISVAVLESIVHDMIISSVILFALGLAAFAIAYIVLFLLYLNIKTTLQFRKIAFPGPLLPPKAIFSWQEHVLQLDLFQNYGSIYRYNHLGVPIYGVATPADAKYILQLRNLPKSNLIEAIGGVWGKGLVTLNHSGSNPWRRFRKIADPAFSVRAVKILQEIFESHCLNFVEYLGSLGDENINMIEVVKRLTFHVISDVIGAGPEVADSEFLTSILEIIMFMYSPLIFVPFGSYIYKLIHWKAWRNGQSTINKIIRERRQAADNKKGKTRVDILDLLLSDEEGRQLTDNEIKEQLFQIFGAGFDTTANTLGWFFYLITTHKQYQQKIMDEIDLLPDLSRENLDKLAFTQQCIQETLRLYPPAINISRQTEEGITLPCGLKVPANTHIEVAPLLMHRNPEYWQDPLEFRPERFAPGGEASQPKAKDAFVPFSLGPRSCIGKVFFYHEARMIIAHALKQFSFDLVEHPDNGVMISNEGLMKPRAVWVKVHRRRT